MDIIESKIYFLDDYGHHVVRQVVVMTSFLLLDDTDVQRAFAAHLRKLREEAKLSRDALAQRSTVPASTIKRFELRGQISFRQLLLLWQSLDDLKRLYELTQQPKRGTRLPTSIEEVLADEL